MARVSHTVIDAVLAAPKYITVPVHLPGPDEGEVEYRVDGSPDNSPLRLVIKRVTTPGNPIVRFKVQLLHPEAGPIARLELSGRHHNPDCKWLNGPHWHYYVEGHGDEWARPWDGPVPRVPADLLEVFIEFCRRTNIALADVTGVVV